MLQGLHPGKGLSFSIVPATRNALYWVFSIIAIITHDNMTRHTSLLTSKNVKNR